MFSSAFETSLGFLKHKRDENVAALRGVHVAYADISLNTSYCWNIHCFW
jgi:hypothetical protein